MHTLEQNLKGLTLLIDVNSDRILSAMAIAVALAAMALLGFEIVSGQLVEAMPVPAFTAA